MDDDQCLQDAWGGTYKCAENKYYCDSYWWKWKSDTRLCCNKSCNICPVDYPGRRLEGEEPAGVYVGESEYDEDELEQMTEDELAAFLEELGTHPHKSAVVEVDDGTAQATNTTEPDATRRLAARLDMN